MATILSSCPGNRQHPSTVVFRRQLRRNQMLEFFQNMPPYIVGMEACAGSYHRARALSRFGHDVRQMPPSYVKPYVRRGKTDRPDAAAICEAVTRPSMRFVPVKSEETQALLLCHKTREFLVRQLTQITNAIRAHVGEFGIVAAKGVHNVGRLLEAGDRAHLPATARRPLRLLAEQFFQTQEKIGELTREIRREAGASAPAKRLQTIPGVGPITATALVATLPDVTGFRTSRNLSA